MSTIKRRINYISVIEMIMRRYLMLIIGVYDTVESTFSIILSHMQTCGSIINIGLGFLLILLIIKYMHGGP